jgi:hypothetical protein
MYFRPDMRSSQDVKEFALCGMEGLVGGGMEGRPSAMRLQERPLNRWDAHLRKLLSCCR